MDTEKDVEDQLDHFIVRKPTSNPIKRTPFSNATKKGDKIHEYIPLLFADILRSSPAPDHDGAYVVFKAPHAPLHFRSCIVHAFIAGRGVHNNLFHHYIADDGTGSLEISIYKNKKEQKELIAMYNEAASAPKESSKISSSLMRLLTRAMESIDGSRISIGRDLLMYGRPDFYRGKVGFKVFSFCVDNVRSRRVEIAFYDYLIDWYKCNRIVVL